MTRIRLIYNHLKGVSGMPAEEYYRKFGRPVSRGPTIISDIEPYQSVVTGETIGGRRQHREHLREHDLIEIGNEKFPERKAPEMPDVGRDIRESMEQLEGGHTPEPLETYNPDEFE